MRMGVRLAAFFRGAAVGAAILIAGLIALIALFVWHTTAPSDRQVVARFERDQAALEELRQTFSHEPPRIIGVTRDSVMLDDTTNWVSPIKAGFSDQRFHDYQELMAHAHVTQVWNYEGETDFAFAASGFASYGWRLTFVYRTSKPPFEETTIDPPYHRIPAEGPLVIYRPVAANWYARFLLF